MSKKEIETEIKRIFQHAQATFDDKCRMAAELVFNNQINQSNV